jgi:hypothetical protein
MVGVTQTVNFVVGCFHFCFLPAVAKGNERADKLAGKAVISNDHAMDSVDVLLALHEAKVVADSFGDDDSCTMVRLSDCQVKLYNKT